MKMSVYLKNEYEKFLTIPGWKGKLSYIWDYYRLWILGILSLICVITIFVHAYFFEPGENHIFVIFNNTFEDAGNQSQIWKDFVEYGEFDLEEKNVEFNSESYFDFEKNATGNSYFDSFIAYTESGALDLITMKTSALIALGKTGRLLDLNSERCERIRDKYGDRFLTCLPEDKDGIEGEVAVAIDVSDSLLITKYHIYEQDCAIALGQMSDNLENIELFLDFIFEKE